MFYQGVFGGLEAGGRRPHLAGLVVHLPQPTNPTPHRRALDPCWIRRELGVPEVVVPEFATWGGYIKDCLLGTGYTVGELAAQGQYYDAERKYACCSPDMTPRACELPSEEILALARDHFTIEGAINCPGLNPVYSELDDLLTTAWALMMENVDLAEWLLCYLSEVYAKEGWDAADVASCMRQAVLEQRFSIVPNGAMTVDAFMSIQPGVPTIFISLCAVGTSRVFLDLALDNWSHALNDQEKFCIAMGTAVGLLHELVHYCGPAPHADPISSCDPAYTLSNILPSLIGQRYPCLGDTRCCTGYPTYSAFRVTYRPVQSIRAIGCWDPVNEDPGAPGP